MLDNDNINKILLSYSDSLAIKKLSKNTIASYVNDVKIFLLFIIEEFKINNLQDIKQEHFDRWIVNRHTNNLKSTSTRRAIAALSSFFIHVIKISGKNCKNGEDLIQNYAKNIPLPKIDSRVCRSIENSKILDLIKCIQDNEVKLLEQLCSEINNNEEIKMESLKFNTNQKIKNLGTGVKTSASNDILHKTLNKQVFKTINLHQSKKSKIYLKLWQLKRTKAIIVLMYASGLRISEALSIKFNQISESDKILRIIGKGQKERIVPILPEVFEYLDDYIKFCPHNINYNSFLFLGSRGEVCLPRIFQREIENLRNELNIPEWFTPHSLRHSFATHLINNGTDIKILQDLLGHSSLSTTQIYTKIDKKAIQLAQQKLVKI